MPKIIQAQSNAMRMYRTSIYNDLPCSGAKKNEIFAEIQAKVDAYFKEHPDATKQEVFAEFGTPDEIVNAYLASEEGFAKQAQRKKNRLIYTGIFLVALAAAIAGGAWLIFNVAGVH